MLVEEQIRALEEILITPNPILVTGSAGTGKSYLLKEVIRKLSEKGPVAVAAPTGIAALSIGGMTLHSMFGLSTDGALLGNRFRKSGSDFFAELYALVIDEVSMVRVDVMDQVDRALRFHRRTEQPFGGLKLVLFGDPYQLPPVVRIEDVRTEYDWYGTKWKKAFAAEFFFLSQGMLKADLRVLELSHIHRYGNDADFAKTLNRIRTGMQTQLDIDFLNSATAAQDFGDEAIRIYGRNEDVSTYNNSRLAELDGPSRTFKATWFETLEKDELPLRGPGTKPDCPAEETLHLKAGARVIFIMNDHTKGSSVQRWVNGSAGTVISVAPSGLTVQLDSGERVDVAPVEIEVREMVKKHFVDGRVVTYGKKSGYFLQLPIKLGWAVTVHKSQGQTLDKVSLAVSAQFFESGQAYVALSRVRSARDLYLQQSLSSADIFPVSGWIRKFMSKAEAYPFDLPNKIRSETEERQKALDEWCSKAGVTRAELNSRFQTFVDGSSKFATRAELENFLMQKLESDGPAEFHDTIELIVHYDEV